METVFVPVSVRSVRLGRLDCNEREQLDEAGPPF